MKKLTKLFITTAVALSFSFTAFAQPVSYAFSSFGGGLPSSATVYDESAPVSQSPELLKRRIETEDGGQKTSNTTAKKVLIVTAAIAAGAVVTAAIIWGSISLATEGTECCTQESGKCASSCGDACGDSCEGALDQSMGNCGDSCSDSMASSCSSSSSDINCSNGVASVFSSGALMPVFIP